jgi:hypothetical protein
VITVSGFVTTIPATSIKRERSTGISLPLPVLVHSLAEGRLDHATDREDPNDGCASVGQGRRRTLRRRPCREGVVDEKNSFPIHIPHGLKPEIACRPVSNGLASQFEERLVLVPKGADSAACPPWAPSRTARRRVGLFRR